MINATTCCGLREFSGLQSTPELTLRTFCRDLTFEGRTCGAYYIFSGTSSSTLDRLAKYIKKNGLGRVCKTGYKKNPNSGNRLMVMIFEPRMKKLNKWSGKMAGVHLAPRTRSNWGWGDVIPMIIIIIIGGTLTFTFGNIIYQLVIFLTV